MLSESYFTVPFKMGKVVVHTSADGSVTAIDFDLEDIYEEKRTTLKLGDDIRRYFEGNEVTWELEPDLTGVTDFKRRVYDIVARIPYGQMSTYGEIARDMGCSGGGRAVGQAMAGNRFPLVVPCHRVISRERAIGGFSSGIDLKRYLLRLEGIDL
ncbi:MAG: MGMT family protein [bacterium]|nr:MGMT family protein [bacterium]